ncbi:deoxyribonuclease-2-alpha-like [Anticarsia gemmatalis]|uniref:deoxyribonuclease-2-alpha-like n=1 Tax=Anticarsia gemmatalis TaxID=129554 RepID=UPI003F76B0CF
MDLNCRDNSDLIMDWWYIYKPPADTGEYFESGYNFTYTMSGAEGRWYPSQTFIDDNSMLQNTLAPLYRNSQRKQLAIMQYGAKPGHKAQQSTAYGILFANDKGGIWISHTVPNFPDLNKVYSSFPEEELANGHMLMCVNLDLKAINTLAAVVQHAGANIVKLTVPSHLVSLLPRWKLAFKRDLTQG